jgi:hypothetical protein
MAISPDKKCQRAYAVPMMEEGALCHGNGGGRGDGSDTTGAFLGDHAGSVERCRAGDVGSAKAKLIVSLAEFREIKEARNTGEMTPSIALALTRLHASCIFRGGKRFITTVFFE